jgi:hypothetical protein
VDKRDQETFGVDLREFSTDGAVICFAEAFPQEFMVSIVVAEHAD